MQENPLIYFDLSLGRYGGGTLLGRVVVELKADVVPKTAQNFKELAESKQPGNGYKGSRAHRIIPGSLQDSRRCILCCHRPAPNG